MSALLANLNEAQLAAVTLAPEHALILAGAGSGKTRVLTTRIAWLVSTGQVSPQSVLGVTFTNKAAREMLGRLSAMLPVNPKGMWIGTFHGLCNRMLRAHARDAGLSTSFQILDSSDQLAAIKRLLRSAGVDDEKYPPKNLQYFINQSKESGLRASAVEVFDDYNRKFVELYAAYDDQCQREGVVDFAELLLRSYELLERNQLLREHYQRRFRHILVDEFQDTNVLQYRWLKLLAGPGTALFAVGDDDQSIYAFRGANVANMSAFEHEFRVGHLIKLEQNYRSHGHILDCANALIENNSRRLGKSLWTDAGHGEPVRVHEAFSDALEAQWLVEEIRDLCRDGMARSDIALLYRSNAQSRVLEHALFSAGIAYRVYGGLRFFERAEIRHAMAYLRLIDNPDDDGAFLRVVNFPARGIGARSVEMLQDAARGQGCSLSRAIATLAGAAAAKLKGFDDLLARLRSETASLSLGDMIEHVIERSGLSAHYATEKEGQERLENLRELVNAAVAFLAEDSVAIDTPAGLGVSNRAAGADPGPAQITAAAGAEAVFDEAPVQLSPLAGFLAHASLESGESQAGEGQDAVQLMTVHAAKGLEFSAVFITGLEEGLFPHENSVTEIDGLEEERRLMYVAITRARERLYLSLAQTRMLHGQTRYNLRSRFLEELPEGALKWLTPKVQSAAGGFSEGWGAVWEGSSRSSAPSGRGGASRWRDRAEPDRASALGVTADRDTDLGRADQASVRAAARFERGVAWRIGQTVSHARFGEGVIVSIEGQGSDARAQINFGRDGLKWLALSVARLEAVG
ncbi:MAG: UvrD-helicase domain-containing protein [Betaproteobacteria bacterium]